MKITFSLLCSIFLFAGSISSSITDEASSSSSSSLSSSSSSSSSSLRALQIRTDSVPLIPFEVQIAIQNDMWYDEFFVIFWDDGALLTDAITNWMIASFEVQTTNGLLAAAAAGDGQGQQQQLDNNNTSRSFDSISLEVVDKISLIEGQEQQPHIVQVSFEGVSLWERQQDNTGTIPPPMEPEIVELIQRATFLEEDRKQLKEALQTTANNLLNDLGLIYDDNNNNVTIADVRAYITPPGSNNNNNNNGNDNVSINDSNMAHSSGLSYLSIIIIIIAIVAIVAIVVACLVFCLFGCGRRSTRMNPNHRGNAAHAGHAAHGDLAVAVEKATAVVLVEEKEGEEEINTSQKGVAMLYNVE